MRGLDIRVALAQTRIMASLDPEEAQEMCFEVISSAEFQGMEDASQGIHQPPILFNGEKLLLSSWRRGYEDELLSMEMRECPSCHDNSGNPCRTHG